MSKLGEGLREASRYTMEGLIEEQKEAWVNYNLVFKLTKVIGFVLFLVGLVVCFYPGLFGGMILGFSVSLFLGFFLLEEAYISRICGLEASIRERKQTNNLSEVGE